MKGKDLTPLCPYCGNLSHLVNGLVIYPHRTDLEERLFYHCAPCDAYVGTHKGTKTPLGRLANAELRRAKQEAHASFDPIWELGKKTRHEAYAWLANELNIPTKECHIGGFDVDTCKKVVEICRKISSKHRTPYPPK